MTPEAESTFRFRRSLGVVVGVLLVLAAWLRIPGPGPRPIAPAAGEVDPFAHGPFTEGSFHADAAELPPGIAARGSYIGGDAFRGTYISGWFGRRSRVELMVAGYPNGPGNALGLEIRLADGEVQRLPYTGDNPGETWKPWLISLPPEARSFRIVAVDGSAVFRGWLAISQPYRIAWRLTLLPQASLSLLAFMLQGALFTALTMALTEFVSRRFDLPPWLAPIGAAASVALLGYGAFWLYFASPQLGRIYSWLLLVAAVVELLGLRATGSRVRRPAEWRSPVTLAVVIGAGTVALTCLFVGGSFSHLAANRFLSLPADNQIPEVFAERLWSGQSPKNLFGDWLSSDRPPLQTGWLLLTKPILNGLGFDSDTSASAGGICFQLLWVPALWAFLRRMGARPRQAAAVIAAVSFSGFFLMFTVFTWPKLGAASLVLAAFVTGCTPLSLPAGHRFPRFAFAGTCAALGWLAHGGVAFSLLGLLLLLIIAGFRRRQMAGSYLLALIAFVVVASPWLAYQKIYEPPGNRLLKWHLAGVIAPDNRSFPTALVDSYRATGWRTAWSTRRFNLTLQWVGHWADLASLSPHTFVVRRWEQCTFSAYAFAWWLPALLVVPWVAWHEQKRGDGIIGWTVAWWLAGWLTWIALMFSPNQAIIHQGTLLTQLLGFALLAWCALRLSRVVFLACATMEVLLFLISWVPAPTPLSGAVSPLAVWVSIIAGLILAEIIVTGSQTEPAV